MERAAAHVRLLTETIATVTSSLDLEDVTTSVARSVARALAADACFVYTYDEQVGELVLQAVYGTRLDASAPLPRMRLGEGLTGYAAQERVVVAVAEAAHTDPRFKRFEGLDEDRFGSLLAVPILDRRDRLAGAMNVRTAGRRDWAADEIDLLTTIASQVAQAFENAQLYERSRRRVAELEALAQISEAVSQSLYQEEALARVVEAARTAVHAELCALVLGSPGALRVAQAAGSSHLSDDDVVRSAADAPLSRAGLVAVPLRAGTRTIGALLCSRRSTRPFTSDEQTLLGTVAHQAATAVESGRGVMRSLVAQEIHHRVKNNLQTVASLLRLRAQSSDPQRALADCVDRVLSIAEVHDLLTASRQGDVDAADLVRRLAVTLGHGLGASTHTTTLEPVLVSGDAATSVALVFCELYANALEHGGGDVHVTVRRDPPALVVVEVRDHGPGLPGGFDPTASLGLKIASALAHDDLGGSLELTSASPGTRATLRFGAAR